MIKNIYHISNVDEEEGEKKTEMREIAKKELDDWYKHHAEQLEKTKENNQYVVKIYFLLSHRSRFEPCTLNYQLCTLRFKSCTSCLNCALQV
jgi:hypothetical protein